MNLTFLLCFDRRASLLLYCIRDILPGRGGYPLIRQVILIRKYLLTLAKGKEIVLPNLGLETVHHVHADDVAQAFSNTIENRQSAIGEGFHIVSEQALTLRGFANAMARWYGQEAKLSFLPWEEWKKTTSQLNADLTWDHIAHSPNGSIEKAKKLLKYNPRYSSLQAVQEAVDHYFAKENIQVL